MSSEILSSIGLGSIDIGYLFLACAAITIVFIILVIVLIAQNRKMKKRFLKFMQGKNVKSLEEKIAELFDDNKSLKETVDENRKELRKINKNQEYAFQKFGLVKYDAFKQMGGMLSFSLALLNDQDNGFIINSVHSSDGCYSYTKEVKDGMSDISLGEEEKKALEIALNSNNRVNRG
ncbi:MAG: DUF4446 family protein [Lachnospiraceae bacterium]|nr:DUF4446 family protein [Lachnospiraceae bacterium]